MLQYFFKNNACCNIEGMVAFKMKTGWWILDVMHTIFLYPKITKIASAESADSFIE